MGTNTSYRLVQLFHLLVWIGIFGCQRAHPLRVEDVRHTNDAGKLRVISLTPSMTEVVDALGALDLVVGVDEFSAVLPQIQDRFEHLHLARVGDFLSPNLEAMLALHPDIIFLDAVQDKFATQLKNYGILVFPIPMQTVSDVRSALTTVGTALGRAAHGKELLDALDRRLDAETRRAAAAARGSQPPRCLFVVDRRPGGLAGMVAAGPGTYIDDLLTRAGALNVLADAASRYVQLPAEEVIRRAPDIILDAAHDATEHGLADWAQLASVPAVAKGRVYVLASPVYVTPGPRLAEAFAGLVDRIWAPGGADAGTAR